MVHRGGQICAMVLLVVVSVLGNLYLVTHSVAVHIFLEIGDKTLKMCEKISSLDLRIIFHKV